VGREQELAELVSACKSAADSDANLFLISGEPGIGKTRLADELASWAKGRGMQVLWGRCWEVGGTPSHWPWIQIIREFLRSLDPERRTLILESELTSDIIQQVAEIVPELQMGQPAIRPPSRENLDPNETRFRLFDAVTNFLKIGARSKPLLIVLDDLHDAGEASLAMLRFVAHELKGAPILIIATHRDAEIEQSSSLRAIIGEIARDARPIPLRGLSDSEVRRFVEVTAGHAPGDSLVAELCDATNGNPLFLDGSFEF
jgi:predicted ATPase